MRSLNSEKAVFRKCSVFPKFDLGSKTNNVVTLNSMGFKYPHGTSQKVNRQTFITGILHINFCSSNGNSESTVDCTDLH